MIRRHAPSDGGTDELPEPKSPLREMATTYVVTIAVWLLFERSADWTHSVRGESGILLGAIVLTALLAVERRVHGNKERIAFRLLGCGAPRVRSLALAAAIGLCIIAVLPAYGWMSGTPLSLRKGWLRHLPGLFAQAGLAEEVLFRGYLFGRVRQGRTFWRAALLAVPPFLLAHVLLFVTMSFPVAAAATLLSLTISFPLARLYDLGGATIWAPALLHAVVQGGIKIVDIPDNKMMGLATTWMAVSMVAPWVVFLVRDANDDNPSDSSRHVDHDRPREKRRELSILPKSTS